MKKIARTLITIVLLFTTASLFAQVSSNLQLMRVDIPFAFSVQDYSPGGQIPRSHRRCGAFNLL